MAEMLFIKPLADGIHRVHFQALTQTRFIADQSPELGTQRIRQGFAERR